MPSLGTLPLICGELARGNFPILSLTTLPAKMTTLLKNCILITGTFRWKTDQQLRATGGPGVF